MCPAAPPTVDYRKLATEMFGGAEEPEVGCRGALLWRGACCLRAPAALAHLSPLCHPELRGCPRPPARAPLHLPAPQDEEGGDGDDGVWSPRLQKRPRGGRRRRKGSDSDDEEPSEKGEEEEEEEASGQEEASGDEGGAASGSDSAAPPAQQEQPQPVQQEQPQPVQQQEQQQAAVAAEPAPPAPAVAAEPAPPEPAVAAEPTPPAPAAEPPAPAPMES